MARIRKAGTYISDGVFRLARVPITSKSRAGKAKRSKAKPGEARRSVPAIIGHGAKLTLARPHRPRISLPPSLAIDQRQKIPERLVEQRRLLDVHGVAALRKDREAGGRDVLLEIDARLDAGVVLVAADDQQRDRNLLD